MLSLTIFHLPLSFILNLVIWWMVSIVKSFPPSQAFSHQLSIIFLPIISFFFVSIACCNNLLNDHLWWVFSFKILWFAFRSVMLAFHFIYICFELFLPISWASLVNCVVIDWFRFCGCMFFQKRLTKNYTWLSYKKDNGLSISVLHLY